MARLETKLEIKAGNAVDSYTCSMSDNYQEVYRTVAKVDNTDSFISLATLAKVNTSILKGSKVILIKNNSPVGVELQLRYAEWDDNSDIDQTNSGASTSGIVNIVSTTTSGTIDIDQCTSGC